ncbi:PAS domain S-box protein [Halorubellus sp. JP-L1]|uniref:PAS domain S-box protein n=1 Tax=Halorubellus sp. JP-L1 TaxID=2715753 RepID=UPI0014084FBD|nr:PAS domain S-box protein [Halorubellus sp. JP-L1]NHN42106.1 PAS domain S-box protein [Halorubellus sp. JP-L1]
MSAQTPVLYVQGADDATRRALAERDDLLVYTVATQSEASDVLGSTRVDCIVCPHERTDGPTGRRLLERLTTSHPGVPAILTSRDPDDDLAAAVSGGAATEYLPLSVWTDPTARLGERITHHADGRIATPDDQTLGGLLATARELMTTRKPDAIASVVTDAAVDILAFERASVWLVDDVATLDAVADGNDGNGGNGALVLAAARPTDHDWQRTYDPGDEPVGRVFESGEPTVIEHDDAALMFFPLGDHGVLAVGADGVDAITDADVQFAEILAANAAAGVERARREQTLSLYRTVVDNVSEMMYVLDDTGHVVLASDEIVDASGYDRSAVLGAHVSTFFPPEDVDRGTELVAELVADGDPDATRTYRADAITKDGDAVPTEVELSLLTDDDGTYRGTIGALRDISDLLAAEAERDRFRSLFEHLPDPVVDSSFRDGEPVIDSVNPAFERVFGHEEADVVGTPVNDVLVPNRDDVADELDAHALADETVSAELTRETADGDRHFLFRGIPYHVDGDDVRAFGIYTDITDQYDREQHLQVLHRVLRHNLRTDMGVVTGYLDQLAEDLDDPDAIAIVEHVTGRAEDAAALADKVHQLEQVIRKDSAFTTEPTDVAAHVRSLADRLGDAYPNATITTNAPDELVANADERLGLAVENLVENAVEHAQRPDPVVELTVEAVDDAVRIRVADNGPGIPDHERDLLTGDRDVSRVEHGDGLGLRVVSWVARSLGGDVSFGDPEAGSEVVLELRTP